MANNTNVDPSQTDSNLSAQEGDTVLCGGPILFPMATGADADNIAKDWGYPLQADVGAISLEALMADLRINDPEAKFMLDVYDELMVLNGGEESENAAAFLSNFMPVQPNLGDERKYALKLIFGDQKQETRHYHRWGGHRVDHSSLTRDGEFVDEFGLSNILGSEIKIHTAPNLSLKSGNTWGLTPAGEPAPISPKAAAQAIIADANKIAAIKPWIDWLIFSAQALTVVVGCGVAVGMIRGAATVGARITASVVLAFEASEGTEFITGYIGGKGKAYNPLKEAFKLTGQNASGASGAQSAEHIYNTLNLMVGFGGKIGLFAGGLYATSAASNTTATCQPAEGSLEEQPLQSQGDAQASVF